MARYVVPKGYTFGCFCVGLRRRRRVRGASAHAAMHGAAQLSAAAMHAPRQLHMLPHAEGAHLRGGRSVRRCNET